MRDWNVSKMMENFPIVQAFPELHNTLEPSLKPLSRSTIEAASTSKKDGKQYLCLLLPMLNIEDLPEAEDPFK